MEQLDYNSISQIIPSFPPLAFPIPLWLSKLLIVVGFFLHAVPMKIVLGGTWLAAILFFLKGKQARRAGTALIISLPVILSFAITQGIVPLLFLQLIYGPLFYSSSILMAVPWILIILILIIAYYSLYYVKLNKDKLQSSAKYFLLFSGLIFLAIGFLFTNNMTLMIHPENWSDLNDIATRGMNLNLNDPQVMPRYTHFVLAALAMSGIYLTFIGVFDKSDKEYHSWLIGKGALIYLLATLPQLFFDFRFWATLSSDIQAKFAGADLPASIALIGYLATVAVTVLLSIIVLKSKSKIFAGVMVVTGVLNVLFVALIRHLIREFSVSEFFKPELIPIDIQWDIFIAFAVLAIALIAYLVWLSKLTIGALRK